MSFDLEATAVQVYLQNMNVSICSLYIPPDYPNKELNIKLNNLVANIPKPFMITMDSNAHHTSWGSDFCDARRRAIDSWLENSGLVLLNTGEPTYLHPNGSFTHIDLTVASLELALELQRQPHIDNFCSDHFPISISS